MKYCYGPVFSRRLGFSLGVDLSPRKRCSFDCVYCQIGKTSVKTLRRFRRVDLSQLKKEVTSIFSRERSLDYITLAGSGEPTLHKDLDKIISLLKKTRPKGARICVITNSSLLYRKEVRRELLGADVIIPSLDVVTPALFKKINRPVPSLTVKKMIDGLISLREEFKGEICLEIMLLSGINDTVSEAKKIKKVIERIAPDKIQINVPVRPPSDSVRIPSRTAVNRFARTLAEGVEIIRQHSVPSMRQNIAHKIERGVIDILRRRPVTRAELVSSFGLDLAEVNRAVDALIRKRKIKEVKASRQIYLTIND